MQQARLAGDDAVMPVIGIILMVAITLILASVMGAFVFDVGSKQTEVAPQASFEFQYDSGDLTITHQSGDKIPESEVTVEGWSGGPLTTDWTDDGDTGDEFTTGDAITISGVNDDDTVRLVWESPKGDTSVLATWEGPKA